MEPLDFEKTEMEHLNFLEFLEEKVLRKSLLSICSGSVISNKVFVHIQRLHRKMFQLYVVGGGRNLGTPQYQFLTRAL